MKILVYLSKIVLFVVILSITSCDENILEISPKSEYSDLAVWQSPALVETFVNQMYRRLDDPLVQRPPAVFCDEAHRRKESNIQKFDACIITQDLIPAWAGSRTQYLLIWNELYKSIRATNIFFENIDRVEFGDDLALKDRMTGEVHFCRAWYYFNLARMYGGVPIIEKVYQLDDNFEEPRAPFEDVINFIVDDLDMAAGLLPTTYNNDNDGRATKGAALALKSRVLLTAASDLFNTTVFTAYSNPELVGYTDKSTSKRAARWQAAKDAAKAVMDLNLYSLYKANPGPKDSVSLNFVQYFTSKSNHEEDIFVFYSTANKLGPDNDLGISNTPVGWKGQGNMAPTGNHVDKYEMRDGTKFDWNNPAHKAHPYMNREPRFYADILYEGAYWQPRRADLAGYDPIGVVQVGDWEKWDPVLNVKYIVHGLDATTGPISPFEASQTNYHERKFINPNIYHGDVVEPITFRYIRYAEVLFNYAEACIELGQDPEARTFLNMIRKRAGMPDITESGNALRQRYRHEKEIEMFLEDQRFWDIRRWVIGPEAYVPVQIVTVFYPLNPDRTTATNPIITPKELGEVKRTWLDKAYFFPILRDEINKNSKLVQNPNY